MDLIADLEARSRDLSLIPELDSVIPDLVRDLRSVHDLGIPRDRKLLGLDLENLLKGMSGIAEMRQTGQDPKSLTLAIIKLQQLATDMRARAASALNNAAEDIAIHASVSARDARSDIKPEDLTREFRTIAAAPVPQENDAPSNRTETGISPLNFGRVSGEVLYFNRKDGRKSAPEGAHILPSNAIAILEKGDLVQIYASGLAVGDKFSDPDRKEGVSPVFVEVVSDHATLYGPVIFETVRDGNGTLSFTRETLKKVEEIRDESTQSSLFGVRAIVSGFTSFCSWVAVMVLNEDSEKNLNIPHLVDVGLLQKSMSQWAGTIAWASAVLCVTMILSSFVFRKDYSGKIPESVRNGRLASLVDQFGLKGANRPKDYVPVGEYGNYRNIREASGLNIAAPLLIDVPRGGQARVVKPLPALPAPGIETNVIDLAGKTVKIA